MHALLRAPQLVFIYYIHTMPGIKVLTFYMDLGRTAKIKLV